jgi:hypothetical protein
MPVLSEPLGSSISTTVAQDSLPADPWHPTFWLHVVHRHSQCWALLSTDPQQAARFGLASTTFPYVILTEIGAQ